MLQLPFRPMKHSHMEFLLHDQNLIRIISQMKMSIHFMRLVWITWNFLMESFDFCSGYTWWESLWLDTKVQDLHLNPSISTFYFCVLIQWWIPSSYLLVQSSKMFQKSLGKTLPEWLPQLFLCSGEKSNQEKRQRIFSQTPFLPGQKNNY